MSPLSPSSRSAVAVAVAAAPGPASTLTNGSSQPARQDPPPQEQLQKWILAAAKVGGATNRSTWSGPGC